MGEEIKIQQVFIPYFEDIEEIERLYKEAKREELDLTHQMAEDFAHLLKEILGVELFSIFECRVIDIGSNFSGFVKELGFNLLEYLCFIAIKQQIEKGASGCYEICFVVKKDSLFFSAVKNEAEQRDRFYKQIAWEKILKIKEKTNGVFNLGNTEIEAGFSCCFYENDRPNEIRLFGCLDFTKTLPEV